MPRRASVPRRTDAFLAFPGSAVLVRLLADKWTIPVIHALRRGTLRTGALRRALDGVSQKMLTHTLRTLEQYGLVDRVTYAVVPPRVEYTLTPLGRSLNEPLAVLCRWTARHGQALDAAHLARSAKASR
ncbi:MAG TPA: helix-turn-helix domain-containing protein [Gemmatimonadaceae bacterium]|nr:helix-turn-helix domain-containing protein [Gemmatimonadaceae bacterium]